MKKLTRVLLIAAGLSALVAISALLSSRPAPAQAPPPPALPVVVRNIPLPVQGTVTANISSTVPVSGTVNANVSGPVPVSGTVNANVTNPLLLPQLGSDTITLLASTRVSPGCGPNTTNTLEEDFTFSNYVVKNSGVFEPFTLPAGKVLVITSFSWVTYGTATGANQLRIASLFPASSIGFNSAESLSTALADSNGMAGGSQTFPTGIVLQNPGIVCLNMYPLVPGEIVAGFVNGFLAPDR